MHLYAAGLKQYVEIERKVLPSCIRNSNNSTINKSLPWSMEKHHLFILLSHHLYAGASCNSMLARQHLKKKKRLKTCKRIIVTSPREKTPRKTTLHLGGSYYLTRLWQAKNRRQNTPEKVNLLSPAEGENQHPISKLDLVDQWLQILAFFWSCFTVCPWFCVLWRGSCRFWGALK